MQSYITKSLNFYSPIKSLGNKVTAQMVHFLETVPKILMRPTKAI